VKPIDLAYTIVIATRNRPQALAVSIPLMLAQTRPATQIIIADSSDDPSENRNLAGRLSQSVPIEITHVAVPKGTSLQRNIGVDMITTPIVAFPDDDSLMRADAMERIMAVYERDTEERIGGVGGFELRYPDEGMLPKDQSVSWTPNKTEKMRKRLFRLRDLWERRIVVDPLKLRGRRRIAERGTPDWLDAMNTVPVEWITGFRMTYRTQTVRDHRFSEELGQYALYEDIDISLRVLREQLVVSCFDAGIYHHRWPSNRANGRAIGAMQILNRAFVLVKSGKLTAAERRAMWRWSTARTAIETLRAKTPYGKQRRDGTIAAYRALRQMLAADPSDAADVYLRLRKGIFETEEDTGAQAPG
jgi:glycosyltransferase involved in cell wall biosynthesis